jgi:GNAT superfamily N-acetyltransferase
MLKGIVTSKRLNRIKHLTTAVFSSIARQESALVFEKNLEDVPLKKEVHAETIVKIINRGYPPEFTEKLRKFGVNVREMLAAGQMCFTASIFGDLIHWTCIAFNETYVREIERKIHIPPDSAYIYAGYTIAEYRGRGISPRILNEICDFLYKKGYRKAYLSIRTNNIPPQRAALKAGFQKIGTVNFSKIANMKRYGCFGETTRDEHILAQMLYT